MELHKRASVDIKEVYSIFEKWNNGEKYYYVYEKGSHFSESIKAKNANQAKYIYSESNSIDYINLRASLDYQGFY